MEYFVSYYDYYQPEAYVPSTDTYIEKDSSINDEIERLRHSATAALLTRRDVLIVASVSCIYGLGSPEEYEARSCGCTRAWRRTWNGRSSASSTSSTSGTRRTSPAGVPRAGDVLEVHPSYEETAVRIEWWGDTIERITRFDTLTGEMLGDLTEITVFPASHYVASDQRMKRAVVTIEDELGSASRSSRARASSSRPSGCGCGRPTTSRCSARSGSAPASRTIHGTSTVARQARPRTRCSTTSPTTGSA